MADLTVTLSLATIDAVAKLADASARALIVAAEHVETYGTIADEAAASERAGDARAAVDAFREACDEAWLAA